MASSPRLAARIGALTLLFVLGCGSSGTSTTSSTGSTGGAGGSSSTTTTSSSGTTTTTTSSSGSGGGTTSSSGSGGGGGSTSSSSGSGGSTSSSSGTMVCTMDAQCDDNVYCNGAEKCVAGACVPGTPPCDDGRSCTADACDEANKACSNTPDDTKCDNNLFCDGVETCDPANGDAVTGCKAGTAPSCDDNIACTTDACDENTKACTHAADDTKCADALFCNGVETCDPLNGGDPVTGCKAGAPPSCDDGRSCTNDSCDENAKACAHAPDDSKCVDLLFCNGVETCDPANGDPVTGCKAGAPPSCDDSVMCTQDFCDATSDSCAHVPSDTMCNDGLFCNGGEVCDPVNGAVMTGCKAGTPPNCDDNIPCTTDACDEGQKTCTHVAVNAACDNGVFCDGQETCSATLGCQPGTPPDCDDDVDCTSDACNEAQKQCTHTPIHAQCNDGTYCNGVETCDPVNGAPGTGCKAGTPVACPDDNIPCTDAVCDEPSKSCKLVPNNSKCGMNQTCAPLVGCTAAKQCPSGLDSECQDGDLCNGVEKCVNQVCQPGTAVDCDDGIGCTIDTCNPGNGQCAHDTNNHAFCDDGLKCNGSETCSLNGCLPGTPVNCNDNIACTADQCTEPNGTCTHTPIDVLCSDGQPCNGIEVCDPTMGCKAGPPFVCPSDGVDCTTEVCDPVLKACKSIPNDSYCAAQPGGCGKTCDPVQGCGNFCQVKTCQGKVYACGDCLDNDGDCKIDSADDQCLGPCSNNEEGFILNIPGSAGPKCAIDCYFDQDSGAGNDNCYWDHRCDPLAVAPNFYPEGNQCAYNPNQNISGTSLTCAQAKVTQSQTCTNYCGPLVPNGCDCFGCCQIPVPNTNTTVTVWLGTEQNGVGTCTLNTLTDPSKCAPCTQVQGACLNTCEHCELCVGKTTLPPDCIVQTCPAGQAACGLPGQAPCGTGTFCKTGCCVPVPQ